MGTVASRCRTRAACSGRTSSSAPARSSTAASPSTMWAAAAAGALARLLTAPPIRAQNKQAKLARLERNLRDAVVGEHTGVFKPAAGTVQSATKLPISARRSDATNHRSRVPLTQRKSHPAATEPHTEDALPDQCL
eukprot:scaffold24914_cov70-Phaeocystis_antarctica.AAC.2